MVITLLHVYLKQFTEHNLQCRTKEIYEAHCASLGGPLNDHIATTYGIVRNSVLNELNYFHVVTGLVPDIMHNILEGKIKINNYYYVLSYMYLFFLIVMSIFQVPWSLPSDIS